MARECEMEQLTPGVGANVCLALAQVCDRHAQRTALHLPDLGSAAKLSYAQLHQAISNAAVALAGLGIKRDDRIVLCLDVEAHALILVFACAYLGATAVVVGNRLSQEEMRYIVSDAAPKMVVTSLNDLGLFAGDLHTSLVVVAASDEDTGECSVFPGIDELVSMRGACVGMACVAGDHPALILYTSGTTSQPKGVVISHAHLVWSAQSNIEHLQVTENDVTLVFFPLCHTMAFSYQVLTSLFSGAAMVLRRVFNPQRFWSDAAHFDCTWAAILPFVCHALAALEKPVRHSFRFWGFPSRNTDVEALFGVKTVGWWGMTELFAIGSVTSEQHSADLNYSIGKPVSGYRYRLTDPVANAGPFNARISADLQFNAQPGKNLFLGYLNKPGETRDAFTEDGWYITGDRFFETTEGVLFFDVRLKDIIKVGGENVSASEIEFAAYASAMISEVAVVSRPDPLLTETPVLFAVLNASGREDQALARRHIEQACRERLADFKRPREIIFLEDFPRAGLRKIAKNQLRQMALQQAHEPA
ncbi:acyl--CoA ligase [Pseudomonas sp. 910_23]|nr:hypothetical protein [Pseudomonas sp. W15Feb34]